MAKKSIAKKSIRFEGVVIGKEEFYDMDGNMHGYKFIINYKDNGTDKLCWVHENSLKKSFFKKVSLEINQKVTFQFDGCFAKKIEVID